MDAYVKGKVIAALVYNVLFLEDPSSFFVEEAY